MSTTSVEFEDYMSLISLTHATGDKRQPMGDGLQAMNNNVDIESQIVRKIDQILKTPAEKDRQFRGLILKNGMKIVLVSDPTSNHSLAHLVVEGVELRGRFKEPYTVNICIDDLQHFLVYAFHEDFHTHDHEITQAFQIVQELYRRLQWAQFFIEPSFDETNIEREVHAVQSEYAATLNSYNRRLSSVLKSLCEDPEHPYCNFVVGNIETLWESCRRRNTSLASLARKFFLENYSANLMHLVVFSSKSLNETTKLIAPLFSKVQNKNLGRKVYSLPYGRKFIGKQIQIVPISNNTKKLILTFQSPDFSNIVTKRIFNFVHHFFNHEGRGGLKDTLSRNGLVKAFDTGIEQCTSDFCISTFDFDLTNKGLANVPQIIKRLFSFLAVIKKKHQYETWVYEEIKQSFKHSYENDPKSSEYSLSASILTSLKYGVPIEEVLTFPYTMEPELDQKSVDYVLSYFTPDNFNMAIMSQNFSGRTDRFNNYMKVNYNVIDIPAELLNELRALDGEDDQTEIPKPSRFLLSGKADKDRNLVTNGEDSPSIPRIILEDDLQRLWYARNNLNDESKISFNMIVRLPTMPNSPLERSTRILLADMLNDLIVKEIPDAINAGYSAAVNLHDSGFTIKLFGEEEKMQLFLEHVFLILLTGKFEISVFEEKLALEGALVHYNRTLEIIKSIHEIQPLYPTEIVYNRPVLLPDDSNYLFERIAIEKHNQTGTVVGYQIETPTSRDVALLNLLGQALSGPTFTKLRSDEQLGYHTSRHIFGSKNVMFLAFSVNGPYKPAFVESRIESFVDFAINKMIPNMTLIEFENLKASKIQNYLKKETNMINKAGKLWYSIISEEYFFNKNLVLAAETEKLKHEELLHFAKNRIGHDAQGRRKLSVHIKLKDDSKMKNSSRAIIKDHNCFKRSMKLSGIPEPQLKLKPLGKKTSNVQ
uniref:Uncharacterized protein n=1 Tax=Romanomermis culicivorax TaxID=13658 RepID=A0A915I690_ROMCU